MRTLFLLLLLTAAFQGSAQWTVKGTVSDTAGRPLAFATIAESGAQAMAMADSAGRFTIILSKLPARLELSAVGFQTEVLAVTDHDEKSKLRILLRQRADLEGVVVKTFSCVRHRTLISCDGARVSRCTMDAVRTAQRGASRLSSLPDATSVYPNPTAGGVTLRASARISTLYLNDLAGHTVQQLQGGTESLLRLDLGRYASGTYLLYYFVEGSGWRTEKVILNRQ